MGNDVSVVPSALIADISIHVPAWGTTTCLSRQFHISDHFNPHSRVGNDTLQPSREAVTSISIHVPAWGTTVDIIPANGYLMNFNPRSRVGNDEGNTSGASGLIAFQSTFPRGERRQGNPGNFTVQAISIHVPAWGTTLSGNSINILMQFQSTFPRGERRYYTLLRCI